MPNMIREYQYKALKSIGWRDALWIAEDFNKRHGTYLHSALAGQSAIAVGARQCKKSGLPTLYDPLCIPLIVLEMKKRTAYC